MAKVKIEDIMDHLSSEMKKAMAMAVAQVAPQANINTILLYKAFVKAVGRKCSTWEQVPDQFVDD